MSRIYGGILTNWLLLAAPLFIFMGLMLEKSGMAENLLLTLERLLGRIRGGLALALLGIIMAASTGIVGASVVLLGVIGLPVMLRQGYQKELAAGVTAASGTLGILIPPSIMLVFMGAILQVSVGDLFKAALTPGLFLGVLYILYILLVGALRPRWAPAAPQNERSDGENLAHRLLRDLAAPMLLIAGVLGSIMIGLATPTEAAGLGAAGATVLAALSKRLNFQTLREVVHETSKTTAMVIFVLIGATCFSAVFKRLGGDLMIEDAIIGAGLGPYELIAALMGLVFILGFFLEWIEISFIVLPLFAPIVGEMDFGFEGGKSMILVWFATLMAVNMQTSFITPPFGYSLFYLRGVVPPEVDIGVIYRAVIPFVVLQLICLLLVAVFPETALWLIRL